MKHESYTYPPTFGTKIEKFKLNRNPRTHRARRDHFNRLSSGHCLFQLPPVLPWFLQCSNELGEQNDLELYVVSAETQFRNHLMDYVKIPLSKAVRAYLWVVDTKGQDVPITGSTDWWVIDLISCFLIVWGKEHDARLIVVVDVSKSLVCNPSQLSLDS
jgi:hypothetical protein